MFTRKHWTFSWSRKSSQFHRLSKNDDSELLPVREFPSLTWIKNTFWEDSNFSSSESGAFSESASDNCRVFSASTWAAFEKSLFYGCLPDVYIWMTELFLTPFLISLSSLAISFSVCWILSSIGLRRLVKMKAYPNMQLDRFRIRTCQEYRKQHQRSPWFLIKKII